MFPACVYVATLLVPFSCAKALLCNSTIEQKRVLY
jgi:hypothetical protein